MPEKKKIFFTYSDTDKTQFNTFCLHFSALQDKADFWYKDKLMTGDDIEEVTKQRLSESDILLHLLSVYSANDTTCKSQFEYSVAAEKTVIPVLLSSYSWETDHNFSSFEDRILPEDKQPIDLHKNFNEICKEIVQDIQQSVFGETIRRKDNNGRKFYWGIALVVFIVGILTTLVVHRVFNDGLISGFAFALFLCIDGLILLKLLFPTNISSLKI